MDGVEEEVRVGALHGLGLLPRVAGGRVAVLCLASHGGQGLGERVEEVQRLGQDQEEREACRRRKGVGGHSRDGAEVCAERGAEGEGDGEACADEGHGRAAVRAVRNVGGDGGRELHIALGQAADNAAEQEGAEVGGHDPQQDGENVAHHAGQQRRAPAISVGEGADDGGCDGLEEGEERAQGAAEEDNVIAGVDGAGKGGFVGVEVAEDPGQEGRGMFL